MRISKGLSSALSWLLAFSLLVSPCAVLSAQESTLTWEQKQKRLNEIIETLSKNLANSESQLKKSIMAFGSASAQAASLEKELITLKAQLDEAKRLQQDLEDQLKEGLLASSQLQTDWETAKSSLTKLENSFNDYRKTAEAEIARLKGEIATGWIVGGITAVVLFIAGYEIGKNAR